MLAACLDSLALLPVQDGVSVQIVVVDNQLQGDARDDVQSFAARSPHPTHYVHEPRRGISFARNASVEKALALGADWLAFIDDDEQVSPGWLSAFLSAAETYAADIVCGPVKLIYPEKLPFWAIPERYKTGSILPEGASMKTAATCNTLASARLFASPPYGIGLKFGEDLGLSGSEDAVLFGHAVQAGAKARFTWGAEVFETVPCSRLTYKRTIQSAFRRGTMFRHELSEKGDSFALIKTARKAASRLFVGLLTGAALPFYAVFGLMKFKCAAIKTGRNFAFLAGVAASLVGRKSNYYLHIDGY